MDIFVSFLSTSNLWANECPYVLFYAQSLLLWTLSWSSFTIWVCIVFNDFLIWTVQTITHWGLWLWPGPSISDPLHCNGFDMGPEVCNMSLSRTLYNNYPLFWVSGPVCQTIWGHLVLFHHCLFSHRKPINVSRLHPLWKISKRELVSHCFNMLYVHLWPLNTDRPITFCATLYITYIKDFKHGSPMQIHNNITYDI